MLIQLNKATNFEGKEYEDLELALEDLSGLQLKNLKKEYLKLARIQNPVQSTLTTLRFDDDFAIFVASKFTKLPIEFFEQLSAGDYLGVTDAVESFFLGLGSKTI